MIWRGGRPRWTAVLAIALLPGVGAVDRRIPADPTVMPWSAVARLNVPGVSRCTAVIVEPTRAVTAAHCLASRALGHTVPAADIHLLLGYDAGRYVRHIVVAAVQVVPGQDLAVLDFRGAATAVVLPDPAPLPPDTAVELGGYGQDRAERLDVDPRCTTLGYVRTTDGRVLLKHDCGGTRGSSGGAVMRQRPDGHWMLAGMQVEARRDGAGGLAVPGFTIALALQGR